MAKRNVLFGPLVFLLRNNDDEQNSIESGMYGAQARGEQEVFRKQGPAETTACILNAPSISRGMYHAKGDDHLLHGRKHVGVTRTVRNCYLWACFG